MSPKTPPKKETIQLTVNSKPLKELFCIIDCGLKPNLPRVFIKRMLPKTPEIVLPIKPKEYLLKNTPVLIAPIIPIKILIKEMKVPVIIIEHSNDHNPFYQFYHPLIFFELSYKQKVE